jgi:phosphate starvation-inducible PhoH-like protein
MGRGDKRRLTSEEEEQVNDYVANKPAKTYERKAPRVRGFAARTGRQADLVRLIEEKEVIIAIGPPGTGKSYCALATAISLLSSGYDKVILIKSVTTLPSEEIGFLKGGIAEKMEPFMMSYT